MHDVIMPHQSPRCHKKSRQGILSLLKFDKCVVLQWNRRICNSSIDAGMVELCGSQKAPIMYCFLVTCNIPQHLHHVQERSWQVNIHDMLWCIPTISYGGLNAYFGSIDSELAAYENLSEAPILLELAIWKSKIIQQPGRDLGGWITSLLKWKTSGKRVTCSSGREKKIMSFSLRSKNEVDHPAQAEGWDVSCRSLQVLVHPHEISFMFLHEYVPL